MGVWVLGFRESSGMYIDLQWIEEILYPLGYTNMQ